MVRFPFVLFADSHQQLVLCTIATFFTNDTASAKLYPLSLDQKKGQTVFVVRLRKLSSGMRIVNPMKCYWSAHVSWGLIHTRHATRRDAHANRNVFPLMLLASSVNTPIDNNRSHLLALCVRVLCEFGLNTESFSCSLVQAATEPFHQAMSTRQADFAHPFSLHRCGSTEVPSYVCLTTPDIQTPTTAVS